jgi:hypothetical protein
VALRDGGEVYGSRKNKVLRTGIRRHVIRERNSANAAIDRQCAVACSGTGLDMETAKHKFVCRVRRSGVVRAGRNQKSRRCPACCAALSS